MEVHTVCFASIHRTIQPAIKQPGFKAYIDWDYMEVYGQAGSELDEAILFFSASQLCGPHICTLENLTWALFGTTKGHLYTTDPQIF